MPPGLLQAWEAQLGGFVPSVAKRRGRPPRVALTRLLPALIFHFMNGAGTLADRLSGCAAFVAETMKACQRVGSHFLFRVRSNIKVETLRRYKDGSRLMRVGRRQKGNPNRILPWLEVREIKHPLRRSDLLQSHPMETAAQEVAAILLASALIATERARAASGQMPVLRISFVKVLEVLQPLWLTLQCGDDLLSEKQKQQMAKRFDRLMGRCVTQPRRTRSGPRAVRQPVTGWPRRRRNPSSTAPIERHIV